MVPNHANVSNVKPFTEEKKELMLTQLETINEEESCYTLLFTAMPHSVHREKKSLLKLIYERALQFKCSANHLEGVQSNQE